MYEYILFYRKIRGYHTQFKVTFEQLVESWLEEEDKKLFGLDVITRMYIILHKIMLQINLADRKLLKLEKERNKPCCKSCN
jgi:hypothetical protein